MTSSIALCTFNGARYLREQLDSFLAQTVLPGELIVCDDGSTDDTPVLLKDFARRAPFPVRVVRNQPTLGTIKNFERAVDLCSGTWIFLSDQDDVWLPDKIRVFTEAATARPDVRLFAGDADLVDADNRSLGRRLWSSLGFTEAEQRTFEMPAGARLLAVRNKITGATCAVHADLKPLLLPFPAVWFHDAWIALLAAATAPCGLVREPLVRYRQHGSQQVGAATLTFARQLELARALDGPYFERQTTFFRAARERLVGQTLRDDGLLDYLDDKIVFSQARAAMRSHNRLVRGAMVLGQALRGRYHRHAQGLKAIAADMIL